MPDEKSTFAAKIIHFNASLEFAGNLPPDVEAMNPFRENQCATPASEAFYKKYYNDNRKRYAILGINPGRFGAGITGVPFTDPKRLAECCDIHLEQCPSAHEPSSKFIYEMIAAYGGVDSFYSQWYINSICPLGFTRLSAKGRRVNCNYYDFAALQKAATPFIVRTLRQQIDCGLETCICFCLGKDKNTAFFNRINAEQKFFKKIVPLDHPRFIVQYRSREMGAYAARYAEIFHEASQR